MSIERIRFRGVTRFRDEVDIDLSGKRGLISFVGKNGSGKTTILECSGPGIFYREFPYRDPSTLPASFSEEGGFLETTFQIEDKTYVARVDVDKNGSQNAFLERDGISMTTGNVTPYKDEMLKIIGPSCSFYASVFGVQGGSGRFSSLKVSDRKEIFRFYLGLDRLEKLRKIASDSLKALDANKVVEIERKIQELNVECESDEKDLEELKKVILDVGRALPKEERRQNDLDRLQGFVALKQAYDRALEDVIDAEEELGVQRTSLPVESQDEEPDVAPLRIRVKEVKDIQADGKTKERELDRLEMDLKRVRERRNRAEEDAEIIRIVPCNAEGKFATCEFLVKAITARNSLSEIDSEYCRVESSLKKKKSTLEELLRGVPSLERIESELREVEEARERWLNQRRDLKDAEKNIAFAEESLREAETRAKTLRKDLPRDLPENLPGKQEIEEAHETVRKLREKKEENVREVGAKEESIRRLRKQIKEYEDDLRTERKNVQDIDPLQLLVRALGPSGIQAYEIDLAGPRVSVLADDLLEACFGRRFSLEVQTQRDLKKKSGVAEDFEIIVHDSLRGGKRGIGGLSGGEKTIVDEALRTSLALFALERLPSSLRVLWRDELSSPLDEENRPRYVALLRRAMEMGGFEQVLYVTHDEVIANSADVVVRVEDDGEVIVQ